MARMSCFYCFPSDSALLACHRLCIFYVGPLLAGTVIDSPPGLSPGVESLSEPKPSRVVSP